MAIAPPRTFTEPTRKNYESSHHFDTVKALDTEIAELKLMRNRLHQEACHSFLFDNLKQATGNEWIEEVSSTDFQPVFYTEYDDLETLQRVMKTVTPDVNPWHDWERKRVYLDFKNAESVAISWWMRGSKTSFDLGILDEAPNETADDLPF